MGQTICHLLPEHDPCTLSPRGARAIALLAALLGVGIPIVGLIEGCTIFEALFAGGIFFCQAIRFYPRAAGGSRLPSSSHEER
jgi:hypothetical protein